MADKAGRNYRNAENSRKSEIKPIYFSAKPPKADLKEIKRKMGEGCIFLLDLLAREDSEGKMWSKRDESDGSLAVFYSLGSVAKGEPDRVIVGRGASYLKALSVVAHWLETLSEDYMFPQDDEDEAW